ncbi:MAG: cache domain-containing protein [Ardenticatenales bacterium]
MLNSLRARVLLVVALALVPTFLLLLLSAAAERRAGVERALESARSTANLIADQESAIVGSTEQLLTLVTSLMDRPITNTQGCDIGLARLIAGKKDYLGISISDADGVIQCSAPRSAGTASSNAADRSYFIRAVQARKFSIGGFQMGRATGRPALAFGAPVIDRTGHITAVVAAGIDLLVLNQRLEDSDLPDDVVVVVADDEGIVLARHPDPTAWIGRPITNTELLTKMRADGVRTAAVDDEDGGTHWHAFATVGQPVSGTGSLLIDVSYTQQALFAAVDARLLRNLLGLLLGALIALGLAWWTTDAMITHRAERLSKVAQQLASGDWSARTEFRDGTELGQLAATFDEMADELQARDRDLQAINADLEDRVARRSAALERTNERLRASRTELRRLSRQLLEIAEQERIRLSREVHDQIGQALTGVKMDVAAARRHLQKADAERAEPRLAAAMDLVDETIRIARRIAFDLRPSVLDDFGLTAAVEWQLEEFAQRSGIRYQLSADVDESAVGPALATAAFRILREAKANVVRHASAQSIDVRLATDGANLTLVVRDDGRGITAEEQAGPHSLGLLGMRERALQLGGTVTVVGKPGEGTTVTLVLPLQTPDIRDTEEDLSDETADR